MVINHLLGDLDSLKKKTKQNKTRRFLNNCVDFVPKLNQFAAMGWAKNQWS